MRWIYLFLTVIIVLTGCAAKVAGLTISVSRDGDDAAAVKNIDDPSKILQQFMVSVDQFGRSFNDFQTSLVSNHDQIRDSFIKSQNLFAQSQQYGQDYLNSSVNDPAKRESVNRIIEDIKFMFSAEQSTLNDSNKYSTVWLDKLKDSNSIADLNSQMKNLAQLTIKK